MILSCYGFKTNLFRNICAIDLVHNVINVRTPNSMAPVTWTRCMSPDTFTCLASKVTENRRTGEDFTRN